MLFLREIVRCFLLATGPGEDALLVDPGVGGLVVLLQGGLLGYEITEADVGDVYDALSLDKDCSFIYSEFETFVNRLFAVESTIDESVWDEAATTRTAFVNSLVENYAARRLRNDFPLIAPSELLTPLDTDAAVTTLSLTDRYDQAELRSYVDAKKESFPLASPMVESETYAVQEVMCLREYYYVWMRCFLVENHSPSDALRTGCGANRFCR